jgi:hypothetical protein
VTAAAKSLRIGDWLIVTACAAFALTSFLVDPISAFGIPVDPASACPVIRAVSSWAVRTDPLWLENPAMLRVQTGISVFLYGPFYILLMLATLRRWSFIQVPALVFSGALTVNVLIYVGAAFVGHRVTEPVLFLLVNLPYLGLAVGLTVRYAPVLSPAHPPARV